MGRDGLVGFLSVNGSVTNGEGGVRQLRLPRMSPFPKLDRRIVGTSPAARPPVSAGVRLIRGNDADALPEMATDVIDAAANYTVENVKRDRGGAGPWSGPRWGAWVGRWWGGHRAARP